MSIGPAEERVIAYLKSQLGPVPQNVIEKDLVFSHNALSNLMKRMEQKGLISRDRIQEGRTRVNYVSLLDEDHNVTTSQVHNNSSQPQGHNVTRSQNTTNSNNNEPSHNSVQDDNQLHTSQRHNVTTSQFEDINAKYDFVSKTITDQEEKILDLKIELQKVRSELKERKKRLTYNEFKDLMIKNKDKGSHYSSYINQKKHWKKEADIKNFYLIYCDLYDGDYLK